MTPWVVATALLISGAGKEHKMSPSPIEIDAFKTRIGFASLSTMDGPDGVIANWDDMPSILAPHVKGKRIDPGRIILLEAGLVKTEFTALDGEKMIDVMVFVSGTGPARAHQKMLALASSTSMSHIPYQPGPKDLGDLAVRYENVPMDKVIWVYRNVCVVVNNHATGADTEPVARAIQKFMAARRVPRLSDHLPKVQQVDLSARQVHVGQEVRVSVTLPAATPAGSVTSKLRETGSDNLEVVTSKPLTAAYKAKSPGTSRVEIRIADRKTLLSPPLSVSIEVLPAP